MSEELLVLDRSRNFMPTIHIVDSKLSCTCI